MVALPDRPEQAMAEAIYRAIGRTTRKQPWLGRLSASGIMDPCLRRVYFKWRGYDIGPKTVAVTDGRLQKIFDTGSRKESEVVEDLRRAGFEVWDKDDEGRQFRFLDESGHFICKADGVIRGVLGAPKTPHLLEIKTHNKNQFEKLLKKPIRECHPKHFGQVQAGIWGLNLDRALYVALCKDDERYHFERIRRDDAYIEEIKVRRTTLLETDVAPAGVSMAANGKECRYCDFKRVCIGAEAPQRNCRTCIHSRPGAEGSWGCMLHRKELSQDAQRAACDNYEARGEGRAAALYLAAG